MDRKAIKEQAKATLEGKISECAKLLLIFLGINFLAGFVLGLMVDLQRDYIVTSNRESGFGRYDVMIEPKDVIKNDAKWCKRINI
mgnify:CR=1 FL=1